MFVILKSNTGIDFPNGEGGYISIEGNGILNTVSAPDIKHLKSIESFKRKVEKGFIIVSDKEDNSKVQDDLKQESLDKQETSIAKNEKSNNVKVTKD